MKQLFLILTATLALTIGVRAESEMDTLRVYFDPDETTVTEFQQSLIDIFLKTHYAAGSLVIAGHADEAGDALGNLARSRSRAQDVANYLVQQGVAANRMRLEAWGETKPLVDNTSAMNRTRNRRVELIGIPMSYKPGTLSGQRSEDVTLSDGSTVPMVDMTADGKPRRVFTVVLRRKSEMIPLAIANSGTRGNCLLRDDVPPCPARSEEYTYDIPVAENLRCPADQVWVGTAEQIKYGNLVDGLFDPSQMDRYAVFTPQPIDSGYAFRVPLLGGTECDSIVHLLREGCYTVHPARIVFDKLKVNFLRGKSTPMREGQTAKVQPDGSYLLHFTNDEPGNLKLYGQVVKGKRRKIGFKNVGLERLTYDNERGAYIVTRKDLKRLRKP